MFDCREAAPLARFWAAALGWQVATYADDEDRLAERGLSESGDEPTVMVEAPEEEAYLPVLYFTEVPEPKQGKNRVHLDVVAPQSVDEEVIRLEGIGAALRNWAEEEGHVWAVMLDPEGNEFCVMPPET